MGLSVVTVANGGLPVVDVTAGSSIGMPVTEAVAVSGVKFGIPVTKVAAGGLAVVYVTPPLLRADEAD
jgi:hypothetical protein